MEISLAPVVQTLDSAIHRINHYPADSVIQYIPKQWIVFFARSDWLLNSEYPALFTDSPPVPRSERRQTR